MRPFKPVGIFIIPTTTIATLLRSSNNSWSKQEIMALTIGLRSKVSSDTRYPAHLIITGHHDQEAVAKLLGLKKFTLTQVTSLNELPFNPPKSEAVSN